MDLLGGKDFIEGKGIGVLISEFHVVPRGSLLAGHSVELRGSLGEDDFDKLEELMLEDVPVG